MSAHTLAARQTMPFSPLVGALTALEALTFIFLGAATQREPVVTLLDVLIAAEAVLMVLVTVSLAKRRYLSRRRKVTEAIDLEPALRRAGISSRR